MSIEPNETSQATQWAVPQAHPYEDWADARAFDGTAAILQPQAQPLFGGTSPYQLLASFMQFNPAPALDLVRQTWQATLADFEPNWHGALTAGVVLNTVIRRQRCEAA